MELEDAIKRGELRPGMTFHQRVWALTSRIPAGKVTTYRQLAKAMNTRGYRAIGHAMNRNPYAPAVPCHRVVASDGSLHGYAGGLPKKHAMLAGEGITFRGEKVDLARHFVEV
jgi:methylated-DNA-[protein]-cysteine S-methyltransferase